jgi:hypothetical protein
MMVVFYKLRRVMPETLWELPVPATQIQWPNFIERPRRECELSLETDEELGVSQRFYIRFEGVEVYRCTYMTSMTAEMIEAAYGKLVQLGMTQWLTEVLKTYRDYCAHANVAAKELQHVMICFDDGPCYEVICAGVVLPASA